MAMVMGDVEERADWTGCAALFHSMSDPNRLAILRELSQHDQRVVDLTRTLDLAQSTVSAHLGCLKECGLVTSQPQGRASLFSLAHPQELGDLLRATDELLAKTGNAALVCAHFAMALPHSESRPRADA